MELFKERLELKIIDTVFDPDIYGIDVKPENFADKTLDVHINLSGKYTFYKVWLFLSGYDLSYVESTTYQLHKTFDNPFRKVERNLNNPDCRLMIWTWGIFEINATILHKSGQTYSISHHLNYGNLLEEFQKDDKVTINYIEEKPRETRGAILNV